ncbi:hypothetical protein [Gluconobacter sp. P1C6_b]|uniref:Cap15 family cyclic dinucleotide receptor domain-containing protein n=1 Tax=Gluconobacter sp. P1C6_b TaxID=2762619 RepID=UPI001C056CE6|nr:hypothetical protein [Gluconobacter sp. P1C6_b]
MQAHEYAIINTSRTDVGYRLGIPVTALTVTIFTVLGLLELFLDPIFPKISQNIQRAATLITAALIYSIVSWIFRNFAWKWKRVPGILKMANLNGRWEVKGSALSEKNEDWSGIITITQDYEKISIALEAGNSNSFSSAASMFLLPSGQLRLQYIYENTPKPGSGEIYYHIGCCELLFDKDILNASGHYFTKERASSGGMVVKRLFQ